MLGQVQIVSSSYNRVTTTLPDHVFFGHITDKEAEITDH